MAADEKDPLLEQIGDAVRRHRRARGWTQLRLAEQAGLSLRFLAQLEAGRGNISITRLAQLADALGCPVTQLLPPKTTASRRAGCPTRKHKSILALVGLRGAGKSTVGKRLAKKLRLPFVELDALIEQAASMPLSQIFSIHGESYYRRLEYQELKEVLKDSKPMVLATGGSIVTDSRTWNLVRQKTITVWLKATPETYWNRLLKQGDTRPMKNNPSAMSELRALLAKREPLYAQADFIVDSSRLSLDHVTAAVSDALRR